MKMRLVVKLKDGRTLSGTYPYLVALARKEHAQQQADCVSAEVAEVR